jgi:hyperosmotically inducible protein
MNQRIRFTRHAGSAQASMVALILAFCLVAPVAAAPPDPWITAKVKLALLTTDGVSGTAVSVDTVKGQVTLYGKASSVAEKEKAEMVAKRIDGVRSVRNLLQVVAPQRQKVVQQSDDRLKKQVEKALQANQSLRDSHISVQSVSNGVVLLAGTANTLIDHLSAVEVAASVPGVRQVNSEIQSPDTLADSEIWHEHTLEPSKAQHPICDAGRDVWITSATKMHLLADRHTPALDINVDTRDGVVTLFGIVPSNEAKTFAEADARGVSGVKRVADELEVLSRARHAAVKVRDDLLQRDVQTTFENRADFKDVKVEVKDCVARLSGTVPDGMERLEAAVVARSTQGVCSVQDDLRVAD